MSTNRRVVIMIALVLGALMLILGGMGYFNSKVLVERGVATEAVVLKKDVSIQTGQSPGSTMRQYHVTVQFSDVDGEGHQKNLLIGSKSVWDRLSKETMVKITYDPKRPSRVHFGWKISNKVFVFDSVLMGIGLLSLLVAIVAYLFKPTLRR